MIEKPKKRPKGKKTRRQTAIRRADSAASKFVIARDGCCVLCGKTENLSCGHVFSRAHYGTRWEIDNMWCQCTGCNMRHEFDPYPFIEYARFRLGDKRLQEVHFQWAQPTRFSTANILDIEARFRARLKELED